MPTQSPSRAAVRDVWWKEPTPTIRVYQEDQKYADGEVTTAAPTAAPATETKTTAGDDDPHSLKAFVRAHAGEIIGGIAGVALTIASAAWCVRRRRAVGAEPKTAQQPFDLEAGAGLARHMNTRAAKGVKAHAPGPKEALPVATAIAGPMGTLPVAITITAAAGPPAAAAAHDAQAPIAPSAIRATINSFADACAAASARSAALRLAEIPESDVALAYMARGGGPGVADAVTAIQRDEADAWRDLQRYSRDERARAEALVASRRRSGSGRGGAGAPAPTVSLPHSTSAATMV